MIHEQASSGTTRRPFTPLAAGNLGKAMSSNDDGQIRDSFMAWFGCAHSKQMGMNGDLILLP